jgi:hypothetical protein
MQGKGIRSLASGARDTSVAAAEILSQLEAFEPTVVVFFAAPLHDGAAIARALQRRHPSAAVIGCSSAGEFSERGTMSGGVSGVAFDSSKVRRAFAQLARYEAGGVESSIAGATSALAAAAGLVSLRAADPARYVGIVLFDGLSGSEEQGNEILGNVAPMLSFVGGSAGDDLQFQSTRVYAGDESTTAGAALLLIDAAVPFTIGKTCSFEPTEHLFRVTRADVKNRVVYEVDGKPVLEAYAAAVGVPASALDAAVFMSSPLGLVIDGEPWIRSPQGATPDGGLKFFCNIAQGMRLRLMRSTDIVADAHAAMESARQALGAPVAGGVAFNCVLRRLEMDARQLHDGFLHSFDGVPVGGFHTYGETWLGHINQTLTAVWFA